MKNDERDFLLLIYSKCPSCNANCTVRDIINSNECPVQYKRAWYILEKWSAKDLYTYGVTLDLGWLTDKGIEMASKQVRAETVGVV